MPNKEKFPYLEQDSMHIAPVLSKKQTVFEDKLESIQPKFSFNK